MKNLRKLFVIGLMASFAVFTACEEENDVNKLSYEEGKEAINNMDSQMASDLEMMSQTEGMTAVGTLNKMDNPFAASKKSSAKNQVISNIKKFSLPLVKENELKQVASTEPFDFASHTGTYTWIDSLQRWDIDPATPSDKIVIIFPADSTDMDNNNATLTIHNYEEIQIDNSTYQPTKILADLYIDDTKYVELDMTASWDASGEPTSLNISVFLKPFTFSGQLENSSSSASVDYYIDYNDEQILSTGLSATFSDDSTEEPKVIDGYLQYRNLRTEMNINAENLIKLMEDIESGESDYTTMEEIEEAINNEFDATIYSDGSKVADIEIRYDENIQNFKLVLIFTDGTVEDAQPYFDNFSTRIQEFFEIMGFQIESNFNQYNF